MLRRAVSVLGAVAVAAALPVVAEPAQAVPGSMPTAHTTQESRSDNRPHPLSTRRTTLRQLAVDQLVSGEATLQGRGRNRTIEMADGAEVDYPATQHAELLTFLADFDGAGPERNTIPEPGPDDNVTYWKDPAVDGGFSREHYVDLFFDGLSDQGGESVKDLYTEMSSGRFDLAGDVADWVTVPEDQASYGVNVDEFGESNENMTRFISDTADAWFAARSAEMTDGEIQTYLARFDEWDRYDADGDGDFNEPDGYIDHFQAVHAGVGEEAGGPEDSIWSHRWAANLAEFGQVGPVGCEACAPYGGVEIGDTGYWIFDYTTEPENGGLGVFAHEFGHDLGLADYYDTAGGANGNGFWTLMDSGSWLGHGDGSVGASAGHMGATEKLFLGWYGGVDGSGFDDLEVVDGLAEPTEITLGPSYHATTVGKQAVTVTIPDGQATAAGPVAGDYLYSGGRNDTAVQATSPSITLPNGTVTLSTRVDYDIEEDYDFAYLQVSTDDGATWGDEAVETSVSTDDDENGANLGNGITGDSDGWQIITADLSAYAGQSVRLRWEYITDSITHETGLLVDNLTVGSYTTEYEDADAWSRTGFFAVVDGEYEYTFPRYYVAENRTFDGYDVTLGEGPYSDDYEVSAPGEKVDHYSYEDGLLVWYANGDYADNNTSEHPGFGANLPVDANPDTITWAGTGPDASANGRMQAFDATFDVDETEALTLTREVPGGSQSVQVPARPSVPVFEDTDVDGYWTPSAGGWFSTKVAGAGTMIQVLSSDEATGEMIVKVGERFVAATGAPELTRNNDTLTAVAPTWFQDGVTTEVTWLRDGVPIEGAEGTSYEITADDRGHAIVASFSGAKAGYLTSVVETEPVTPPLPAPAPSTPPTIQGTLRVGQTLTAGAAQWPVQGQSGFVWSIAGTPVSTAGRYVVRVEDLGKMVTLTETFTSPGYDVATSAAQGVVGAGVAPTATTPLRISGAAQVGSTLTVDPATWPVAGTTAFVWSADGKEVGTGRSLRLTPKVVGERLTVTEYLTNPGYEPGKSSTQLAKAVVRAPVTLSVAPGKAKRGKKVPLTVGLKSGRLKVQGKVSIEYAGKKLRARAVKNGKVTVRLPAKPKGTYWLTVSYAGTPTFAKNSKTLAVKVK